MLVMNGGMKQSDHFCFPLHRKSQQKSFVVITSVFEITYMTQRERERERESRGIVFGRVDSRYCAHHVHTGTKCDCLTG